MSVTACAHNFWKEAVRKENRWHRTYGNFNPRAKRDVSGALAGDAYFASTYMPFSSSQATSAPFSSSQGNWSLTSSSWDSPKYSHYPQPPDYYAAPAPAPVPAEATRQILSRLGPASANSGPPRHHSGLANVNAPRAGKENSGRIHFRRSAKISPPVSPTNASGEVSYGQIPIGAPTNFSSPQALDAWYNTNRPAAGSAGHSAKNGNFVRGLVYSSESPREQLFAARERALRNGWILVNER